MFCIDELDNTYEQLQLLPLIHSTSSMKFEAIVDTKKLKPTPCNFFKNENNLYFYYGRPSYKKSGTKAYSPLNAVCTMIFDTEKIKEKISRIFPFDTGAYPRYQEVLTFMSEIDVMSFSLSRDISECKKIVSKYWGSNNNYYDAIHPKNTCSSKKNIALNNTYMQLISPICRENGIDDRCSTIEITTTDEVDISAIIGIVIPYEFSELDFISDLQIRGAYVEYYPYRGETSEGLYGLIRYKVETILKKLGVLHGLL